MDREARQAFDMPIECQCDECKIEDLPAEELYYCACGEHHVEKKMMWPDYADCFECATVKEYAEYMEISVEEAQVIADGVCMNE